MPKTQGKEGSSDKPRSKARVGKNDKGEKEEVSENESGMECSDKSEKSDKQTKIDKMLSQMAKNTEPNIQDLIAVINEFDRKMRQVASKDYIEQSMQSLVSEKFVSEKLEKMKTDLGNEIRSDLDKVYEQLRNIKAKLLDSVNEMNELKNDCKGMQLELEKLRNASVSLEDQNRILKDQLLERDKQVKHHEFVLNEHEQYSRANNIRIYGLEDKTKEESAEESSAIVIQMLKDKLDLKVFPQEIDIAHRLGKFSTEGNRPVIVRFVRRSLKKKVISLRRNLKGTAIVIREDLTNKNAKLLENVSVKTEVKNAWSDNGHIIALLLNGKKMKVTMYTDITKPFIPEEELSALLDAVKTKKQTK